MRLWRPTHKYQISPSAIKIVEIRMGGEAFCCKKWPSILRVNLLMAIIMLMNNGNATKKLPKIQLSILLLCSLNCITDQPHVNVAIMAFYLCGSQCLVPWRNLYLGIQNFTSSVSISYVAHTAEVTTIRANCNMIAAFTGNDIPLYCYDSSCKTMLTCQCQHLLLKHCSHNKHIKVDINLKHINVIEFHEFK